MRALGGALWLALLGAPAVAEELPTRSAQALHDGDCALCHSVPGEPAAERTASCAGCHAWIRDVSASPAKRAKAVEIFPLWARYERVTQSYLEVPSLEAAMARLDPEWVRTYLADPHDLRPGLPETMPRLGLDSEQLQAISLAFSAARAQVSSTPAPDLARVAAGEQVFLASGCAGCHSFGARHMGGVPLAPDLAHARERLDPDMAAAWIADPKKVSSAATMPGLGLGPEEVLAVRDYILLADPQWTAAPMVDSDVEPTDQPVRWAEVEERVFGRICVHCHMDPEQNDGRAGPGNAGGFGFEATGIALQTREQVMAVADRIPAALLRRRHEAARDVVQVGQQPRGLTRPEKPGMPLGLPPLSDADLSLVLGWFAQGSPP